MPKLITIHPDRLRPNQWNSNVVSPENEEKLATSLKELGQFKPVVARYLPDEETDTDYEILGGEHRWLELRKARHDQIHVFDLGEIDDLLAKKISLADNARYGSDDSAELAKLMADIGADQIHTFLPFTDSDVTAIFASAHIALDELDLPDEVGIEARAALDDGSSSKTPKTHTIMRFKVTLGDAESITALIAEAQRDHGFSGADDLTNAGDALVHLLLGEPD